MADITKIQPMGDSTQYTLGARYLTHTPNNTTTFLRGDNTWSNTITDDLIIGEREVSTAPSSETAVNRFTIIPYYHTGGPWYIKSSDDSSSAFLKLFYGSSELIKIKHDGTFMNNLKASITGNAATATKATQDGAGNTITSKYVTLDTAQTISNHKVFYTPSSGNNAYADGSAIEIREVAVTTTNQSAWTYAPKLGFHWGGRYQGTFGLGSNGQYYLGLSAGQGNAVLNIGQLQVTQNSNTLTIGSLNTSYCHFQNSANIPFYFNKPVHIDGSCIQYSSAVDSRSWINGRDTAAVRVANWNYYHAGLSMKTQNGSFEIGVYTNDNFWITYCPDAQYNAGSNTNYKQVHMTSSGQWYGAVWNDYAEYRKDNLKEIQEPGRCVYEMGDGTLSLTTQRLMCGCEIISDTFGFAIGQDENNGYNTPIASSGRVLAYPYENIEEFRKNIGHGVCSGPNGTVSIMTEEEEEKYPLRAIGTISEIPNYDIWGSGGVKVNGRVWIRVR